MRESFVLHSEYIENLPEEYKNTFLRYIYDYGINKIEPTLSGLEKTIWLSIKTRIDKDTAAYDRKIANLKQNKNRTESERKIVENRDLPNGSQTETERKTNKKQENRTDSDSVTDSVTVNDIDSGVVSEPKSATNAPQSVFEIPTEKQIQDFCKEQGFVIDVSKFYNTYESKGWHVGLTPMHNWKAAVINWHENDKKYGIKVSAKGIKSDFDENVLKQYVPQKLETDVSANLAEIALMKNQGGNDAGIQQDEELIY